jgi:putative ABC transport system ATP-binding protein
MIELQHISKTFNSKTPNETRALQDVNLKIDFNRFTVIVGSNGSGKSTLLNALAGSISVSEGKIILDNNDITCLKEHQRSKWIARIFQNPLMGTAPDLSILENFRLASTRNQSRGFRIGTDEKFRMKIRERIAMVNLGLEHKLDQPMGTLSGGQRQALTLLMAVMGEPKILLMDEPTAALDPKTSEVVMSLATKVIHEFKLTAFLVTHNLKDAITYGDRIILMHEGMIAKDLNQTEKSGLQLNDIISWF